MNFKALLSLPLLAGIVQLSQAQCNAPSSSQFIDINNVRTKIHNGGDMWWDLQGQAEYEFPSGSGRTTFFAGSIWIGGKTASDSLQLAAMRYRANGVDFFSGPLTDQGTVDQSTCNQFDRIFSMYKTDIDLFTSSGAIAQSLYDWPGRGNPHTGMPNSDLAPFVDVNGDGIYDPEDGDYPAIKGDFAIWFVYNDVGNLHSETYGDPIGIEVHQMVYAYATNNVVNNSIFYDYTFIKKSPGQLFDTHFGQFVDPDLGYAQDDYIACSSSKQLGIVFNGDSFDEDGGGALGYGANPPASAVKFLRTPLSVSGGMTPMSSFAAFSNGGGITSGDPIIAADYYNYLTGKWRDGGAIVLGGNGLPGSNPGAQPYPFMFDMDAPQEWTECSAGNTPNDRRFVMSVGPFTMNRYEPLQISTVSYSVLPSQGNPDFSCTELSEVINAADTLQQFYFDNPLPDTSVVGIFSPVESHSSIGVYPNPSKGSFSIHSDVEQPIDVDVFDLSGRTIATWKNVSSNQALLLQDAGIYIIHVTMDDKQYVDRLVIH